MTAPTVYPARPYVQRRLEDKELLLALDVPGTRKRGADADTLRGWRAELSLPFKVRHAVGEWVQRSAAPHRKRRLDSPRLPAAKRSAAHHPPTETTREGESLEVLEGRGEVKAFLADEHADQKVAKHDDAEVPVHLWNDRVRAGSCVILQDRELDRL